MLLCRRDNHALAERLEDLPAQLRGQVISRFRNREDLVSFVLPLREREAACSLAEGDVDGARLTYAYAAERYADEAGRHDERAWRCRVAGLRLVGERNDEGLPVEIRKLLPGGRSALGADHPLIAEAERLLGGAEPAEPASGRTREALERLVPEHPSGSTPYDWYAFLRKLGEHLGNPTFVFGPPMTMRWLLDDGALDISPHLREQGWSAHVRWLDEDALEAFHDEVHLDSKAGEAQTAQSYLWFFWPEDADVPEGSFCHGGFGSMDRDDLTEVLELTLAGLPSDLQMLPPEWDQTAIIEWTDDSSATTVRLTISRTTMTVTVDGDVWHSSRAPDGHLGDLVTALMNAIEGVDLDTCDREGWFTHGQWTMITAG